MKGSTSMKLGVRLMKNPRNQSDFFQLSSLLFSSSTQSPVELRGYINLWPQPLAFVDHLISHPRRLWPQTPFITEVLCVVD